MSVPKKRISKKKKLWSRWMFKKHKNIKYSLIGKNKYLNKGSLNTSKNILNLI